MHPERNPSKTTPEIILFSLTPKTLGVENVCAAALARGA
jgi:hypothetical protein